MDVPAQVKRASSSSLCLFVLFRPSTDQMMSIVLVKVIFLTQSTDLNVNLLWKTLTDTLRNNVLPAIWASLSPVKLTHKINHSHSALQNQTLSHLSCDSDSLICKRRFMTNCNLSFQIMVFQGLDHFFSVSQCPNMQCDVICAYHHCQLYWH